MGSIVRDVDIEAPAPKVWSLLEDVRRLPDFSPSTISVENAPARLDAVGQSYAQVGSIFGKRYRSTWTVEELVEGRRIRSAGTVGPGVGYCLTQDLEPTGPATCHLRVAIDYRLPLGALGRLAARVGVERRAAAEAGEVLTGIKRVAERSDAPRPA